MAIQLTADALRQIFPSAPKAVIDAFLEKEHVLDQYGVNHTRNRLSYALAQVEHETGGYRVMRENINYTPQRAVQVWPTRFKTVSEVYSKIGSYAGDPEFKIKLMDSVYGGRMGNRSGTHDGSNFIGRGGPQITGRDCYANVGRITGVPLVDNPLLAEAAQYQPEIMSGFIHWKKLNTKADLGDFKGYVKVWNGGYIGLGDRQKHLADNARIIERLDGGPPTPKPPKEVVDEATVRERQTRNGAVVVGGAAAANEAAKGTGTVHPETPMLPTFAAVGIFVAAVVAVVVTVLLIQRKRRAVETNWR